MAEKEKSLFEKIWEKGADALKGLQQPGMRKAIKGNLRQAELDAESKKHTAQSKLEAEYAKLDKWDINKCIEYREDIRKADAALNHIKGIWTDLFGEEMPPNQD